MVGWWWFFLYKEYVFPIVFVRLFDMCSGGSICLVMKPAPLQLQALGAKHPEPKEKRSQNWKNPYKKRSQNQEHQEKNNPKSKKPDTKNKPKSKKHREKWSQKTQENLVKKEVIFVFWYLFVLWIKKKEWWWGGGGFFYIKNMFSQ